MPSTEKLLDSDEDDETIHKGNTTDDGRPINCAVRLHTFILIL